VLAGDCYGAWLSVWSSARQGAPGQPTPRLVPKHAICALRVSLAVMCARRPLSCLPSFQSGKGLRCSFASVQDVDWETKYGRHRVRLSGEWVVLPDVAVVVPDVAVVTQLRLSAILPSL
jgi:hypothetical protein